jgi:2'-5' RNA ligase
MRFCDPLQAPATTQPCTLQDQPEWHRGRARYWLWAIPLDCPAVLQRLQSARELLDDWLHPPGERQAHVTLFVCGFANTAPELDDDIAPAMLEAQRQALETLRLEPFELSIGDLGSFASAAFLDVQDNGKLEQLRQVLARFTPEVRQAEYVPHLTVGLYRRAVATAIWCQRAARLRNCPPLPIPVHELQLLSYAAAEPQGKLRLEARITLGDA